MHMVTFGQELILAVTSVVDHDLVTPGLEFSYEERATKTGAALREIPG